MLGYVIIELTIFDKKELEKYKKLAPATVAAFDGKIIIRSDKKIILEGDWNPQRLVIIEFPSVRRAKEWWNSESYNKVSMFRKKSSRTNMIIIEGV
jgi:uncharacterized protein (DUF1330 family)